MRLYLEFLGVLMWMVTTATCYPQGPPDSESVCREMFPVGHGADSQADTPPFVISLSQNMYVAWHPITVTIRSTKNDTFIDGFFLQARRTNCSHHNQQEALGIFKKINNESYLKTVACLGRPDSAISHSEKIRRTSISVTWNAPGSSDIGNIYFVATVVKSKTVFWTTVYSKITRHFKHDITSSDQVCDSRTLLDPSKKPFRSGSSITIPDNMCVIVLFIVAVFLRIDKH